MQITIKTINNIIGPNGLVSTLLVFEAYPRISKFDSPTPTITQCITAIKNTMKKVQKVRAERQVANALNQKNRFRPMVSIVHDLSLDLDVIIWQKGNARYSKKWTEPYKLLAVKNKTCKV